MAKFCGKCGSKLDEATGLCPKCDADRLARLSAESVKEEGKQEVGSNPKRQSNKKNVKKQKKADKKAAKKAKKKERRAQWSTGKKVRHFFAKLLIALLLLTTLIAGVQHAVRLHIGKALFTNGIDIPSLISEIIELPELFRGESEDIVGSSSEFAVLDGKFTDIKVIDEKTAIQVAQQAADSLGISKTAQELSVSDVTNTGELIYYRLQQNFHGYPVFGKSFVVVTGDNGEISSLSTNCFDIGEPELIVDVSQSEVNQSALNYIGALVGTSDFEFVDIEDISDDKLCIYATDDHEGILTYQLYANTEYGSFTIFVNTSTAEIVFAFENITDIQTTFTYSGQKSMRTFIAEASTQANEMRYLGNNGVDITIAVPKSDSQYDWYQNGNSEVVTWSNGSKPDRSAVDAIFNMSSIYSYYNTVFDRESFDGAGADINVYIHTIGYKNYSGENKDAINNAYFWISPNGPIISFTKCYDKDGKETFDYSSEIDVIGHEYTHGVVSYSAHLTNTKTNLMPGAINEAVADIMGYCAEAYATKSPIDWTSSVRTSIKENNANSAYIYHLEDYKGELTESHSASTIISYAAYLMNSAKVGQITDEQIGELWYHTILTLPSNCTFSILREHVEMTAKNLGFSEEQKNTIANAFEMVGITTTNPNEKAKHSPDIELKVYDKYSALYDNYTVSISGTYNTGWFGWSWFGWFQKEYNKEITVASQATQKIELPNNGVYTIKITDNNGASEQYIKEIEVKSKFENKIIAFATTYENKTKYTSEGSDNNMLGKFEKSDIPPGAVEFNGHYYCLYDFSGLSATSQNTWENALSYCQGVNGYLATITSREENEFVYNYIKTQGYESAYFGLSNKNDEAAWKWCNSETADYSNWAPGEPNGEANECYGMFYYKYPDGTWNDGSFEEDPQPIVPESENTRVFVKDTDSGLNLRSLPQHQSDLMGTVSDENAFMKFSGEIAQGLGSDGNLHDWYKVYLDNGIEGWVRSDLIREVAPAEYGSESTLGSGTGKGTVGKGGTAFICEWGEYSIEKDPQGPTKPVSNKRDIVLVLDTSGSMSGTPMEETKKASVNFIETILEEDASIGIVTYDNSASRVSDFSVDKSSLENIISGIYDGGGTNIEAGLREAHSMLSASSAKKRIIVLMSDGEPNDGKEGDDLVVYADKIKKDGVLIYTLGFFESLGGYKSSAQQLMERIASDGCHYEVANADDLVFFFEDMADQINGQKYIYVRIACPVDVSVTYEGETLSSAEKDLNLRTDFGTLTFEQDEEDLANGIDDRVKVLRLKEGTDYNLKIVGTGHGIMDYTIGFMDDNGDYSDLRRFENVKITKRTVIDTEAAVSKQSTLNIDEDGDGKYDVRLRAGENGYGEEIEQSKLIYFVVGGCGLLCLLLVVIIVRKVQKRRKRR